MHIYIHLRISLSVYVCIDIKADTNVVLSGDVYSCRAQQIASSRQSDHLRLR